MLYEQNNIAKRWKEYLEILYKGETLKENETNESNEEDKSEGDDEIDPIMREEFDKALRNLKNKKATGIDGIQAEIWKEAGEKVKRELFQIIKVIYETSELPEDYVNYPHPKENSNKEM
ncbi:uncharacterized protein LOC126909463 [Daktulosphaira vitifoliae]|uniref:uncharacterized protein LOC126909463 n=1 Tax=Daktulosphaira vitifoliae TaxID=58002 RepID=UPI0021AA0C02|nr:uncharacterized protein LOC126909463 [Daktulosphaira vitifoliae]